MTLTAAEYSDSVREWLTQAYQWQAIAYSFPSYLAYRVSQQQLNQQNNASNHSNQGVPISRAQHQNEPAPNPEAPEWHLCTIPSLWKRVVAEFIDFLILFFLKLLVTFMAGDWLNIVDLDKYDVSFLTAAARGSTELDLQAAMDLTSDFVLLEMIHRLVVCLFEALCLHRGIGGQPGGATPGKYIMGLRVVLCLQVTGLPDTNRVQVSPAKDLGFVASSVRAILKNAAMAFFVPVFFTFIYNRTVYDIMSKSIVIEVPTIRQQQQNQQ